ncbi:MAG: hypothetical protein AB4080_12180 [Trichodesmium sp.]
MNNQPLWISLVSGAITAIATAIVTMVNSHNSLSKTEHHYTVAYTAGITSFITTFSIGIINSQKLRSSTTRLGSYLEDISIGNYNIRSPIYADDKILNLSKKFNSMADVICNLLINIKIQEERTEKDKEKIASQVIKLLDKVDGIAHGQLYLKAKVECEELGIISYCFNITIEKFQQLIKEVDNVSQEIDILITDSQSIFHNLSIERQSQIEEIASFLKILEVIVDCFYQRAYMAWEAEQIAQEMSSSAAKSYLEVDNILNEIIITHRFISEINHQVKRFAEYNEDLKKIQSLIYHINNQSKILLVNTEIFTSRKNNNEDLLKIAKELQELATNWELVKKKLQHFQSNIQSLNLTIPENNIVLDKSEEKKIGEEVKRGLTKIVQKVYKYNNYIDNVASLGENQIDNLQKITDFLQIIQNKNLTQAQVTKKVYEDLQKLLNLAENMSESVRNFHL